MCGKLHKTITAVLPIGVMFGVAGLLVWRQEQPQVVGSSLWAEEPRKQEAKPVAQRPAEQKPSPFPEDIEKAWAAAGAEIGWMRIQIQQAEIAWMKIQTPSHRPGNAGSMLRFVPRDEGQKGDIPAFRLRAWQAGLLPKLPEPEVPYGLDLTKLPLTDRWLVDLRTLKNLQALDLTGTEVTDAGLKELAGLKNLQWIDLFRTQLTDTGIAELKKALPYCEIVR